MTVTKYDKLYLVHEMSVLMHPTTKREVLKGIVSNFIISQSSLFVNPKLRKTRNVFKKLLQKPLTYYR